MFWISELKSSFLLQMVTARLYKVLIIPVFVLVKRLIEEVLSRLSSMDIVKVKVLAQDRQYGIKQSIYVIWFFSGFMEINYTKRVNCLHKSVTSYQYCFVDDLLQKYNSFAVVNCIKQKKWPNLILIHWTPSPSNLWLPNQKSLQAKRIITHLGYLNDYF